MSTLWDQSDYLKATEILCAEATRLENILQAAGKEIPARPGTQTSAGKVQLGSNVLDNYEAMSAHVAKLHVLVSLSVTKPAPVAPAATAPVVRAGNDNDDKPKQTSDKNCESCQGCTRCSTCNGTGVKPGSTAANSCPECSGSGKCSKCSGTGKADQKASARAKYDPDEQILAARGVKSLPGLNAKMNMERGFGLHSED